MAEQENHYGFDEGGDDDQSIVSTRGLEAFSRKVTTTATHLIGPNAEATALHYQAAMAEVQKQMKRPTVQRSMFAMARTTPTDIMRSRLSTHEIQHRALTYLPDELLANIPDHENPYSLFQGFQASFPELTEEGKKFRRRVSRGRKMIEDSDGVPGSPKRLTQLKKEKAAMMHEFGLLGTRKSMASYEIREIDNKIANLHGMRRIILERLAGLEQDEAMLEHDISEMEVRVEDAQALVDEAEEIARNTRTKDEQDLVGDADDHDHEFMSQSVYEKIPSSTGSTPRKAKKVLRKKSMPILHEHFEPGTSIREVRAHKDTITAVDFDAPFGTMVTAALDDTVRVWDLNAGRCMGYLEGHTASVRALQVEDNILATGSMDATIRLWDLSKAHYDPHGGLGKDDDEDAIAFGTDNHLEPPDGSMSDCPLYTLEAHVDEITALHFRGDVMVSGSADKTIRHWDLEKGRCVQTLDVMWAAAASMTSTDNTWRPTGRSQSSSADFVGALQVFETALACGTADGMVRLWDLRSGQVHRSLVGHTGAVTCLQFDDVHLVTGSIDRSIRIWDLRTGSIYDAYAYDHPVTSMMFDERRIVSDLVNVLESRAAAYFEEKQILLMFRDVCNAVYAMHCQMPPIAHRDLKAENVLMGADGVWKLCDFGSTSTNHKRFERPEEMGIEEDIIRKHTTPAYRAPEMWDLYRRELISEKVDIWALGCLLYRIAYLKSAFDGESKLQILNGNYRIPELPRYSSSLVELIKDMLTAAPEVRPDIMQIWRRVNELLPVELRKSSPDRPLSMANSEVHAPPMDAQDHGNPVPTRRAPPLPSRTPPPPPTSKDQDRQSPPMVQPDSKAIQGGVSSGSSLGAFWSSQYAQESVPVDDKGPVFDKDPGSESVLKQRSQSPESHPKQGILSSPKENQSRAGHILKSGMSNFMKKVHASPQPTTRQGYDEMSPDINQIRLSSEDTDHGDENTIDSGVSPVKASASEIGGPFHDDSFNAFVADFDNHKPTTGTSVFGKEGLHVEVDRLKEELEQVRLEKAEITSKYEKLTAICRSQRQEIQELKQTLSTATAPNVTTFSKEGSTKPVVPQQAQVQQLKQQQKQRLVPGSWHSGNKQEDKIEGSIWELQEGMSTMSSHGVPFKATDAKEWQPFGESLTTQLSNSPPSNVSGASNGYRPQHHASGSSVGSSDTWGFVQDSFTPVRNNVQASKSSGSESKGNPAVYDSYGSKSDGRSSRSITQSQPAGWAGF